MVFQFNVLFIDLNLQDTYLSVEWLEMSEAHVFMDISFQVACLIWM